MFDFFKKEPTLFDIATQDLEDTKLKIYNVQAELEDRRSRLNTLIERQSRLEAFIKENSPTDIKIS